MDLIEFEKKIFSLIESRREDEYWDFKECHHSNKAKLLHDIICMANNRSTHDGYIIFGIQDKTYKIIGVEDDNKRRNQQIIIDFIKSKKFSMDIRPKIQLVSLCMHGHEIDVLIVYNTLETPYYITSNYQDQGSIVKANHIYTRVGDSNTAIDKSADGIHVEYLWKKRFGIHLSPFEKVKLLLKSKSDWLAAETTIYNITNPEYTLRKTTNYEMDRYDFYSYAMTNNQTYYGHITVNYFGTELHKEPTVLLDGGRYLSTVPKRGTISLDKSPHNFESFRYFIKDHISYTLHRFLLEEDNSEAKYAHSSFHEIVLLFESETEKNSFIHYVEGQLDVLENFITNDKQSYDYIDLENLEKKVFIRDLKVAKALKKIQVTFNEIQQQTIRNINEKI